MLKKKSMSNGEKEICLLCDKQAPVFINPIWVLIDWYGLTVTTPCFTCMCEKLYWGVNNQIQMPTTTAERMYIVKSQLEEHTSVAPDLCLSIIMPYLGNVNDIEFID
jgi:hypothetical protein